ESQRRGLRLGKVAQLDAPANVERRGAGIGNQVRSRRGAHQAKGEPPEFRIVDASVVELADAGKELVRRKRQAPRRVNFVDEEDQARRAARGSGLWVLSSEF